MPSYKIFSVFKITPEGDASEILVPVSVKAPDSLTRTQLFTSLFQISAHTLQAEQRIVQNDHEHVVSFPHPGQIVH